ncbi:hypothetical protein REMIM1_CH01958 [Rhizobium etli bv. mimosae str. Mim1]|nr:hypothetical protein REMIM1_CH01958 [Rhizobium etli bv. mimosae str. Mim1]
MGKARKCGGVQVHRVFLFGATIIEPPASVKPKTVAENCACRGALALHICSEDL